MLLTKWTSWLKSGLRSNRRRNSKKRRPDNFFPVRHFEKLEDRTLLSSVVVGGGTGSELKITLDGQRGVKIETDGLDFDVVQTANDANPSAPDEVVYSSTGYLFTSINVVGSSLDDLIDLSGAVSSTFTSIPTTGSHVTINGNAGDDEIVGSPFNSNIWGGDGNDSIVAGAGDDNLLGENHNDTIFAGGGNDSVYGFSGNDELFGNGGVDLVVGGDGDDLLRGHAGNDSIVSGFGNDTAFGDDGADTVHGDGGADTAYGGTGDDSIYGGGGNDSLVGDAGRDRIYGNDDDDTIFGWGSQDTLIGGNHNDLIYGNQSVDVLWGGLGHDSLYGQQSTDYLYGEFGNDILHGGAGAGADYSYGDAGADTLWSGTGGASPGDGDQLDGGDGYDQVDGVSELLDNWSSPTNYSQNNEAPPDDNNISLTTEVGQQVFIDDNESINLRIERHDESAVYAQLDVPLTFTDILPTSDYTVTVATPTKGSWDSSTGIVTMNAGESEFELTVTANPDPDSDTNAIVASISGFTGDYFLQETDVQIDLTEYTIIGNSEISVVPLGTGPDYGVAYEYGQTPQTFRFTRTDPGTGTLPALTVYYDVGYDGGLNSGDYSGLAAPGDSGQFTFAEDDTTFDLVLTPVLDTNDEFDETVTVTITSGSYDISSTNDSASIDIKDAPVVKIEATDSTASEGNPVNTGRFYVSSTSGHVPGGSFTVDLEFLSTSSNPVADLNVDYTVNPSESSSPPVISFTLLDTGDFQNVTVTPINDANMSEGFEDVRLRIQDADGAAIDSANRQATVTIADNGGVGVPNVSVFADFVTAQEGMSPVGRFRLTRSGATTSSLTVPLTAVTNPSGAPQATSADYTLSDGLTSLPGSVTFNPGDFVAYIMVDGILDTVEEGEELTVQITTNPGLYYVVDPLATIAIADTPTVSISTEDGAASEDGDTGQFKISRTGASNSDALTVHLSLAGTATFSTSPTSGDYTVTNLSPSGSNYTAQIPAGADYVLVTIVPNSDSVPDDAETVSLSIIDPAPAGAVYAVGTATTTDVSIAEGTGNNSPVTVDISAPDATGTERSGDPDYALTFTVSRSNASGPVTDGNQVVNYSVSGVMASGDAENGVDYLDSATSAALSGTVTIPDGSSSVNIVVHPNTDALAEPDETFTLTLSNSPDYLLGTTSQTGTITDRTPTYMIEATERFTSEPTTDPVYEGVGFLSTEDAEFVISRDDNSLAQTVNVTIAGTAVNGTDYVSIATSYSFTAGVSSIPINIQALADDELEGLESVTITIDAASDYAVDPDFATDSALINDSIVNLYVLSDGDSHQCGPLTDETMLHNTSTGSQNNPSVVAVFEQPSLVSPTSSSSTASFSPESSSASFVDPDSLQVTVTAKDSAGNVVASNTASPVHYSLTGYTTSAANPQRLALGTQLDLSSVATDAISFEVSINAYEPGGALISNGAVSRTVPIFNSGAHAARDTTVELGPGFVFSDSYGFSRIAETADTSDKDAIWIDPSGEPQLFRHSYTTGSTDYLTGPRGNSGSLLRYFDGSYKISFPDGSETNFNSDGRPTTIHDRIGLLATYTYSGPSSEYLETITGRFGEITTFVRSGGGALVTALQEQASATAPIRTTTLSHTAGQVSQVTYPRADLADPNSSRVVDYTFTTLPGTSTPVITQITDNAGSKVELDYDDFGNLEEEDVLDGTIVTKYRPLSSQVLVAAGTGTSSNPAAYGSYVWENLRGEVTIGDDGFAYELNEFGDIVKSIRGDLTTDSNLQVIRYDYNDDGLVETITFPSTGTQGEEQMSFAYDTDGNLETLTYPDGKTESWSYGVFAQVSSYTDRAGISTTFTLDPANGNVTDITHPTVDGLTPVESFTYNSQGLVTTYVAPDPDGTGPLTTSTTIFAYVPGRAEIATITNPGDASQQTFNWVDGLLESFQDERQTGTSVKTSYTYDDIGRVKTIIDAKGGVTTYDYAVRTDGSGPIGTSITITEPDPGTGPVDSPVTEYFFDKIGRIEKEVYSSIATTEYSYDSHGRLETVTDPLTSTLTYSYDERDNVEFVERSASTAGGEIARTHFAYDTLDRLIQQSEEPTPGVIEVTTEYEYDTLNRLVRESVGPDWNGRTLTTTFDYDDNGNLEQVILPLEDGQPYYERETRYLYDNLNRLTTIIYPKVDDGGPLLVTPVYEYEYDARSRLVAETDARDYVTAYAYDERDRLTTVTLPDPDGVSGGQASPVYQYGYDVASNLTSILDPLLRQTTYQYDDFNQVVVTTWPDPDGPTGSGGANLDAPTMTYLRDGLGRINTATDHLGRVTDYDYDRLSRVTSVTLPDADVIGGPNGLVYSYSHNAVGQVTQVTAPGNRVTDYGFDLWGQLRTVELPAPAAGASRPTTAFGYDNLGRQTSETDPEGRTTEFEYDGLGQLIETRTPAPNYVAGTVSTEYEYDKRGSLTLVKDPLSHETAFGYDNLGRRTSVTDARLKTTEFTYDLSDNRTILTDPNDNATHWEYDGLNRVTEETVELDGADRDRKYFYDPVGNLVGRLDRDSGYVTFEYDDLDRLTTETGFNSGAFVYTYAYDNAGRLLAAGNSEVTLTYAYDHLDRTTQIVTALAATAESTSATTTVDYGYDADGDHVSTAVLAQMGVSIFDATQPAGTFGFENTYGHDDIGRVTSVTQQNHSALPASTVSAKSVTLAYNDAGQLDLVTRKQGTTTVSTSDYGYDTAGYLDSILHHGTTDADTIVSYGFNWNGDGTLDHRTYSYGGFTQISQFNYDETQQLTAVVHTGGVQADEDYSYDDNGNRTNSGYTHDEFNRLTQLDEFDYEYDYEGNRTLRTTTRGSTTDEDYFIEYTWDQRNRLAKIEILGGPDAVDENSISIANSPTKQIWYVYDAFDRRIARRIDENGNGTVDKVEYFIHDGEDVVMVIEDARVMGGATVTRQSLFLHGPDVDQVFAAENENGGIFWALTDHQGTVRDIAEYSSAVDDTRLAEHRQIDSFGNIESLPDGPFELFAYTGREWDADAELYYYRARWYDPKVGRFISEDPIGFAAGDTNLSRYVGNGSPNATDPSGLDEITEKTDATFSMRMVQEGGRAVERNVLNAFNPASPGNVASMMFWGVGGAIFGYGPVAIEESGKRSRKILESKRDELGPLVDVGKGFVAIGEVSGHVGTGFIGGPATAATKPAQFVANNPVARQITVRTLQVFGLKHGYNCLNSEEPITPTDAFYTVSPFLIPASPSHTPRHKLSWKSFEQNVLGAPKRPASSAGPQRTGEKIRSFVVPDSLLGKHSQAYRLRMRALLTGRNYNSRLAAARELVIQSRAAAVKQLAKEVGWQGKAIYDHDPTRASTIQGNHTITIRSHAFYEPGGLKSVFLHEMAHSRLPLWATESQVDFEAVRIAEEVFGNANDIVLPFVD